jgi:heptosyltransferase-2
LDGIDGVSEEDVLYPTIDGLYAALANARAVICNNSSALHIAQAFDVPCVALTGPSDPVRWGTYRRNSFSLERSMTLPCHPCREKRCVRPHAPCIDLIEVNHVIDALERLGIRGHANNSTILS